MLAAEDAAEVAERTGATRVAGTARLGADIARTLYHAPRPVYVPLAPEEGTGTTRDSALAAAAWAAADPFDHTPESPAALAEGLRRRFAQLEIRDLSPVLDALRLRKSESEIELMRTAARLCGLAVDRGDAVDRARCPRVRARGGRRLRVPAGRRARRRATRRSSPAAPNAWYGHYNANDAALRGRRPRADGLRARLTATTRATSAACGRSTAATPTWQRELYGFVLDYHAELIRRGSVPGVTPEEMLDEAAAAMRARIDATHFSKPHYDGCGHGRARLPRTSLASGRDVRARRRRLSRATARARASCSRSTR